MVIKNLGGNSGCNVFLYDIDEKTRFVHKVSSSKAYNKRLEIQCNKQQESFNLHHNAPEVYSKGFDADGLFYFDMEYIHGKTLSQYIKNIPVSEINRIVDNIVDNIIQNKKNDCICKDVQKIFQDKITNLQSSITIEYSNLDVISKSISILKKHDWSKFTRSQCHGDLTLENIIISSGKLYFIDFLDSFYDSWLLDFGKIMQDVQVLWAYRFEKRITINTQIRLHIFHDILIKKMDDISPQLKVEINYSLLLHLLRIYPYAKDIQTLDFLNIEIKSTIGMIEYLEEELQSTL